MMPKTLFLEYPDNFSVSEFPDAFLPKVMHTRPTASTVEFSLYTAGRLVRLVLRSEYDALLDIVVDADIIGDVGIVRSVEFREAK